jgi:hypothetical protein
MSSHKRIISLKIWDIKAVVKLLYSVGRFKIFIICHKRLLYIQPIILLLLLLLLLLFIHINLVFFYKERETNTKYNLKA